MRNLMILPLVAVLAACAGGPSETAIKYQASEKARLEKTLAGLTPGKPVSCVRLRDLDGPESYGDTTLVFRRGRGLVYVNETTGSCNRIGKGDALITRSYTSELCRGDIAQGADLRAGGFPTDTCVMGEFIPYKRAS